MSEWTGVSRHGAGWRATVSQGRGRPLIQQHFPADTPLAEMQRWRAETQAGLTVVRKQRAYAGTFEADARRYLATITALPTYRERCRTIAGWIALFGHQRRDTITAAQIRAIRDRWLVSPRSATDPRPLAPGTINKRLRALSNLFTVLDGDRLPNPVRRVPEAREPDPEPRALDYATIRQILAALPDADRAKKGGTRGTVSQTKIRLRCLAFCPLTPGQLMALTPTDLDLPGARVRLPSRKKGRGAKAVWSPLTPEAQLAFGAFHRWACYGRFSVSSLRKSFKTGIARAGLTLSARVYDLRHSFATVAFQATQSLEAVASLLQHTDPRTTARYAAAAEALVLHARGQAVAQQIGITPLADDGKTRPILAESPTGLQRIRPRPKRSNRAKSSGKPGQKVGGR